MEDYRDVEAAPRDARFLAVTLFDFKSSMARKNPQGIIAAFGRAFPDDPTARLVIKTQNGKLFPDLLAKLRAMAPPNVEVIVHPEEGLRGVRPVPASRKPWPTGGSGNASDR